MKEVNKKKGGGERNLVAHITAPITYVSFGVCTDETAMNAGVNTYVFA